MIKTILFILLLGLTATVQSAPEAAPSPATPNPPLLTFFKELKSGQPKVVVVYGTSLTFGGAWAVAMKDWFNAEYPGKVTFFNSARGGANSDWGLASLQGQVLSHNPDLVVIEFSYNDAVDDKIPLEKAKANLDQMVQSILKVNPKAAIVLQVMNVNWDSPIGKSTVSRRAHLEDYNDNYRSYAREHELPLLDHFPNWLSLKQSDPQKYQTFVPDGTHPTPEGSLTVTWPTIKALLENAKNHRS